ncbi:hypothetical protein C3387_24235 [Leclercia sp. LSNIH6]|uniref:DNA polymerase V n=1 Tax=Leclercia adecarboxylata TaxID=83655 RepID=A0ABU6IA68_9ENTR|nr:MULTISPECIES: hypothetical protein [Leclercia]MCG1030782.1 hypothetical protein [Bacillus amyloliquefaciens]POU71653.1 hypothetical protein C3387_24235 [Leclercia sp. LSNIH6]POV34267.1 hypothetical protein C3388_13470 [Leclercia sp. LSNIH5]POW48541.1 hypothetical protein C3406_24645 [Leclercia sp. LSNIH8]POW66693.1 hypothetical protein C3389_10460 [Leclercia sp. LSNIH2]SSW87362.1 Uncharacterised protein [Klebsiella pneumoniae]
MPRRHDIHAAFVAAIQQNPNGYQCLRTDDFIEELAKLHWHFSQADANDWIERYQECFVDKTPDNSENRLWMLRNMGRVL